MNKLTKYLYLTISTLILAFLTFYISVVSVIFVGVLSSSFIKEVNDHMAIVIVETVILFIVSLFSIILKINENKIKVDKFMQWIVSLFGISSFLYAYFILSSNTWSKIIYYFTHLTGSPFSIINKTSSIDFIVEGLLFVSLAIFGVIIIHKRGTIARIYKKISFEIFPYKLKITKGELSITRRKYNEKNK